MTTIAVKNGVMAADSLVSYGNSTCGYAEKIRRTKGGILIAWAGPLHMQLSAFDWFEGGAEYEDAPPDLRDAGSGELVALLPDKRFMAFYCARPLAFSAPFYAIGSGSEYAIGAMATGASAAEAVHIASRFDHGTGGEVRIYTV